MLQFKILGFVLKSSVIFFFLAPWHLNSLPMPVKFLPSAAEAPKPDTNFHKLHSLAGRAHEQPGYWQWEFTLAVMAVTSGIQSQLQQEGHLVASVSSGQCQCQVTKRGKLFIWCLVVVEMVSSPASFCSMILASKLHALLCPAHFSSVISSVPNDSVNLLSILSTNSFSTEVIRS